MTIRTRLGEPGASRESGITALELLVIVVIIAAIVAVGVPAVHARAESAVLDANMRSLSSLVQEEMLQGYQTAYQPSGAGRADSYLSNRLEQVLQEAVGGARYVNPFAENDREADVVLNSSVMLLDSSWTPPAVFITDNPQCAYEAPAARSSELGRQYLAGSLLIHFNSPGKSVDVFYLDREGERSPEVMRYPTG